jgi:hypothetical protein
MGPPRKGSEPVERSGVLETAGQAFVLAEGSDLKVITPCGDRRGYPNRLRWNEAEPAVVGRVAEQPDQGLAERVGRAENSVHQGGTQAGSLAARENTQRP